MELRFAYAHEYEQFLLKNELADLTVSSYLMEITVFFAWLGRTYPDIELHQIQRRVIDEYLRSELKDGKATSTVNKKVTVLKSYFDFLWKRSVIGLDPCSKLKRFSEQDNESNYCLDEEALKMFLSTITENSIVKDELIYYRNLSLVSLSLWGGLSVSEMCNLIWRDINWQDQKSLIGISLGNPRWVEMKKEEMSFLKKYHELNPSDPMSPVFQSRSGKKISPRTIQFIFEGLTRVSGVHVYPQLLRNTFIIQKLNDGYSRDEIAMLLGINQVYIPDRAHKLIS